MVNLTKGTLKKILSENLHPENPILQILQMKTIQNNGVDATTRYKVTLFDGEINHTFGILATQKNHLVEENKLRIGSFIRLTDYAANVLSKEPQKVVIILMNFDILNDDGDDNDMDLTRSVNNENLEPNKSVNKQNSSINSDISSNASSSGAISSSKFFKQENLKQPNKTNTSLKESLIAHSTATNSPQFNGLKVSTISSLNPYQNKWSVKVRVTNKTAIRTWSNSRGEGKLFSVDFIDTTGEIKASIFNDECDKFYDLLQVDHVYYVSKAKLKTANRQYSTIDNDYEMGFSNDTVVEPCNDDDELIPRLNYNLIPLSELLNKNANDLVDVIGIVKSCSDLNTIVTKQTNKELKKRDVHLIDSSNCSVSCTLWGKTAEDFDSNDNPVVLLKGAKVSEFGGRTLSVLSNTLIQMNPDIPEAHTLRGWYDQGGNQADIHDISSNTNNATISGLTQATWKCLEQITEEQLGMNDKADYFSTTATIVFAKKDNSMYMACPSENCNKKVIDQNNGLYRCEKCGKDFDSFKWRMILSLNIADHSESQWVTGFQEGAEAILGISAQELGDLKTQNSPSYDEYFSNCVFNEYTFKLRAKMETYNDERRVKVSVVNVDPIDYVACSRQLLQKIRLHSESNNE